ncbi:MAG TPA: acid phosphatase, partial [Burkholderiaceae bacterium]
VAWGNSGALVMGHFDYSGSALYKLAQQYVLADAFFQGAFGGSFLNHQYLICACAPEYPAGLIAGNKPSVTELQRDAAGAYLPRLALKQGQGGSPASALEGNPRYTHSGNLTPANYFGDGKYYAVNTMQPAYQPSGNPPADMARPAYADDSKANALPALTQATIGDRLSARNVSWKWYSGAWNLALADGMQAPDKKRAVIYAENANQITDSTALGFQAHHQPFNYYAAFDPARNAAARKAHLQDYSELRADIAAGRLPAVAFYKPEGVYNQHPGYANLSDGDARIAELVAALQKSPQWGKMVIVITFDEFGGQWDHASPPKADLLGPGTRIPAIVISPLAKKGTVDHTPYDTGSILRLITRRFGLEPLPGVLARDAALVKAGNRPMGDLTNALSLD